ncbi:MAG: hypothetical protein U0Q55_11275 [Vicinamibacterales bacterium]
MRLFGTDGVRGKAGVFPLDHATVRRLGAALVRALPHGTESPHLLVGRDTRESGGWIEAELAHGAGGEGAEVTSVGVVPTPAVAYLTRAFAQYDAGVVISASHNPFEDNGIKVFSGRGEKFTEAVEREIEGIVADTSWDVRDGAPEEVPGAVLVDSYLEHLRVVLPDPSLFSGFTLAIDCANGATTPVAPGLFRGLGFETVVTGAEPDGRNINLLCGSTHPEGLSALVVKSGAQMGVAFDGDGDRAIFVDHLGRVVNGDAVLLMCARQLQREGRLPGNAIVATVMSNIGLELALRRSGIEMIRTSVGDKYVMEEMLKRGIALGGEQSGRDLLRLSVHRRRPVYRPERPSHRAGDRPVAGRTGRRPDELPAGAAQRARARESGPRVSAGRGGGHREHVEQRVAGQGRLLVRYSGTEPLLRVMLEGKDQGEIRAWAQSIIDVVKAELG